MRCTSTCACGATPADRSTKPMAAIHGLPYVHEAYSMYLKTPRRLVRRLLGARHRHLVRAAAAAAGCHRPTREPRRHG
jgi:hypothetical protein